MPRYMVEAKCDVWVEVQARDSERAIQIAHDRIGDASASLPYMTITNGPVLRMHATELVDACADVKP